MSGDRGRRLQPGLDAQSLLEALPEVGAVARVRARTVASAPSPHLDLRSVVEVARAAEAELAEGADGVVVTQGTDTIEESAFALELMLGGGAPVVVTGAMRPPGSPGADGPANLLQAVQVAASLSARDLGVVVLMDGAVHASRHVAKVHTGAAAAFRSSASLIGEVMEGRLTRLAVPPRLEATGCPGAAPPPVALLTAVLGDDGALVDALPDLGYAAAVVAGMGAGHVHPTMARRLGRLADRMPVVVASRTGSGPAPAQTYAYEGAEIDLAERGAMRAGWLAPLKARVATAVLLAGGADEQALRRFFADFGGG